MVFWWQQTKCRRYFCHVSISTEMPFNNLVNKKKQTVWGQVFDETKQAISYQFDIKIPLLLSHMNSLLLLYGLLTEISANSHIVKMIYLLIFWIRLSLSSSNNIKLALSHLKIFLFRLLNVAYTLIRTHTRWAAPFELLCFDGNKLTAFGISLFQPDRLIVTRLELKRLNPKEKMKS